EPATDIQGARNAGIHSILIDRKGHHHGEDIAKVQSFHALV
ncbi:MAG: HAD hydrolase-like protein, partial [Nitrospinae bacterium]|nr:HAD hydrolase-like protein [Nitrospinota bacterium]